MALDNKNFQKFLLPAEWTITQKENSLIISGGADAKFEIELDHQYESFFAKVKNNQSFTRNELNLSDKKILEELLTAEIIVPKVRASTKIKVAVIGDSNQLKFGNEKSIVNADLTVVVRTNSTFAKLLEKINYQDLTKPHLFVDLSYHHTISIGPLVIPGETACIACLQGRLTTRWGDDKPPKSPKISKDNSDLAKELIKAEIHKIQNGDTSLTNKTVSWNFQDRKVRNDQLLKVPFCPICSKNKIDLSGKIALPWVKR